MLTEEMSEDAGAELLQSWKKGRDLVVLLKKKKSSQMALYASVKHLEGH